MHSTEAYESLLQHAAAQISRPECGFFEPGSLVWQVNRQRVMYLGGLRAILMQIAHPLVAQGVAEHSDFMHDPIRRFTRTIQVVQKVLFGDKGTALQAARQVHCIHRKVAGKIEVGSTYSVYHATDPELLLWVYATLIDSLRYTHDLLRPSLAKSGWEQLYRQGRPFAHLFGIPDEVLPANLVEFEAYVCQQVENLRVSQTGKRMAWIVLRCPDPIFTPMNTLLAAGTIQPELTDAFELPWNNGMRLIFRLGLLLPRLWARWTPPALRYSGLARKRKKSLKKLIS